MTQTPIVNLIYLLEDVNANQIILKMKTYINLCVKIVMFNAKNAQEEHTQIASNVTLLIIDIFKMENACAILDTTMMLEVHVSLVIIHVKHVLIIQVIKKINV